MDSSSLETEVRRFIDAVFRESGEWLEPEHWVFSCFDDVHSHHVIFVSKVPYAHHAEKLYQCILSLGVEAQITVDIFCLGPSKPETIEGTIAAFKRYKFESLRRRQTDHERIISEWLSLAGEPEKLVVQQTDTKLVVCCGDSLQAFRLSHRLDWLVKTGLEYVEIYIGARVFNSLALERLAKDDRHRFIYSLLHAHQEILEAGSIAIDADKVRIYCASKEEAIALYSGRWDLAERAQELQLPQQFEVYYFGDDKQPCLYKPFSSKGALLAKGLRLRGIEAQLEDFDKE